MDDFGDKGNKTNHREDDDDSIDEENGDTKRDGGEIFDDEEEEDFWATRKLVEQHRRDGCSVSSISKSDFQRHTIGQTRIERCALDAVGVRVWREPPRARFRRRGIWRSDEICREEIEEDRVRGARDDDEWKGNGRLRTTAADEGQQTPTQQHLTYPDHFCACKGFAGRDFER